MKKDLGFLKKSKLRCNCGELRTFYIYDEMYGF
jgi:hypothetical protein